jgi:outer membrane immunogenic protein
MKQFKSAVSLFISASLLSSTSFAHAPSKDDAISTPLSYNWSGLYAGLNAGIVKNTLTITDNQATTFYATIQQVPNPKPTGGFQVGYRRQLNLTQASGVFGLEFSADFVNAKSKKEYGSPYALYQLNFESKLKELLLLQLIGGIAADRTLLFLAGGFSWSHNTGRVTNLADIPFFDSFNINKQILGTAVSAGVEYAFSENVSARIKVDYILPNSYSVCNDVGDDFEISNNIVQGTFGVNYRFG